MGDHSIPKGQPQAQRTPDSAMEVQANGKNEGDPAQPSGGGLILQTLREGQQKIYYSVFRIPAIAFR